MLQSLCSAWRQKFFFQKVPEVQKCVKRKPKDNHAGAETDQGESGRSEQSLSRSTRPKSRSRGTWNDQIAPASLTRALRPTPPFNPLWWVRSTSPITLGPLWVDHRFQTGLLAGLGRLQMLYDGVCHPLAPTPACDCIASIQSQ